MSDDLKINLLVSAQTENKAREDETPRKLAATAIVSSTGDKSDAVIQSPDAPRPTGGEQTPSLRPSPISGVTPPIATRWKKGESGNPGGKPRGLQKAYVKHLATVVDEDTGETNADKIAKTQISIAQSWYDDKSTTAAREIRQATEGDDEVKGGFNIGTLNMAILQQVQRMAEKKELEG